MMDRFALAFREQQQLFLFDKTYLVSCLFSLGGLATLSGRFVVQFFQDLVQTFGKRDKIHDVPGGVQRLLKLDRAVKIVPVKRLAMVRIVSDEMRG